MSDDGPSNFSVTPGGVQVVLRHYHSGGSPELRPATYEPDSPLWLFFVGVAYKRIDLRDGRFRGLSLVRVDVGSYESQFSFQKVEVEI